MENGLMLVEMVLDSKNGQTDLNTKECGKIIELAVKEN